MARSSKAQNAESPDTSGAFPRLSGTQIQTLAREGERRRLQKGDLLFRAGQRCDEFFVILSGTAGIVEGYGPAETERILSSHGPGRFLGELNLLSGQPELVTAVALEPSEVLVVPMDRLRAVMGRNSDLADVVLRACIARRSLLVGKGSGIRILGSRFSSDTKRLREFANRNRIPHRFVDLEANEDAEALLRDLEVAPGETPLVLLAEGHVFRNPSTEALAEKLGLKVAAGELEVVDLAIVGSGPAGLAAAVYAASEGLSTVVLDRVAPGGQANTSPRIENYLGFPSGISGTELTERAVVQAKRFGARVSVPSAVTGLEPDGAGYALRLSDGETVVARTVLVATGCRYRKLQLPNLAEFEGVSVYYAATQMEAAQCAGGPMVVVGGGNSAGQAALFLACPESDVHLVLHHSDLERDMSRYLVDQITQHPHIEVIVDAEICSLAGERGMLESVEIKQLATGDRRQIDARAMFVFIGTEPRVGWLEGRVPLDREGYVLTGGAVQEAGRDGFAELGRDPFYLETALPGVFAAGDVRSGSVKRVASAVGEGAMAVRFVYQHLG